MDYSKLSDFEINKLVGKLRYPGAVKVWDFCNNPSDAWPIIVDNNICITFRKNKTSLIGVYNDCPNECKKGKELREAMIVYLMMQEGE